MTETVALSTAMALVAIGQPLQKIERPVPRPPPARWFCA